MGMGNADLVLTVALFPHSLRLLKLVEDHLMDQFQWEATLPSLPIPLPNHKDVTMDKSLIPRPYLIRMAILLNDAKKIARLIKAIEKQSIHINADRRENLNPLGENFPGRRPITSAAMLPAI
jgi:hypothetical protein